MMQSPRAYFLPEDPSELTLVWKVRTRNDILLATGVGRVWTRLTKADKAALQAIVARIDDETDKEVSE